MSTAQTTSQHPGIVVSTAITAGSAADGCPLGTCNGQSTHVEGIVVSTAMGRRSGRLPARHLQRPEQPNLGSRPALSPAGFTLPGSAPSAP